MFHIPDIFLVLALLSTIATTVLSKQPVGPEGPVGFWILAVFPCLFLAILIYNLASRGSLDFLPGGHLMELLISVGILIAFGTAVLGSIVLGNTLAQAFLIVIPYVILAGFAVIIHHADFPNLRIVYPVATVLLGGAALAGWGLTGTGIVLYMKKNLQQSAQRVQQEKEFDDQRSQWEMAEFAKLDDSASLGALLPFTWSGNDRIRQQARQRVSSFQGLDEQLIELLDGDVEDAVTFIAKVYENPPAKLAPAWGRMLERQLKNWNSLQFDEHAGTWEQNLKPYFLGAQKIQLAGGTLHDELRLWHEHLKKCKGLGGLADYVKKLL